MSLVTAPPDGSNVQLRNVHVSRRR